jgi:hypothetical protein
VSKFGISFDQAMWELPIGALNQLLIWDDLVNGQKPRWDNSGALGAAELDSLLADALTAAG